MNKENIFCKRNIVLAIILCVLLVILILFGLQKGNEMIIQGEIETKSVDLSSKITGRVKKLYVSKGDMVEKDQLLITLDTPDISAKSDQSDAVLQLAQIKQEEVNNGARAEQKQIAFTTLGQAETNLELAKKTYTRMKKLNEEGVIPTQKLDEISAQYKNAQKAVEVAKSNWKMYKEGARYEDKKLAAANVKRAKGAVKEVESYLMENQIKSPVKGQVTDIFVEEGELVGAGYTIITIVDNEDSWVVLNLREDLLSKITMGSEFDVKIPAIGKAPFKVKVNYISPLGNFATWRATKIRGDFDLKTFEIHAKPIEKIENLRAGMTVVIDWNKVKKN